jgi:hypothetical protein
VTRRDTEAFDLDKRTVTPEVGDEGGTPGDVELGVDRGEGTGSEASETWRPTRDDRETIVRDEEGEGRRNP